ncbi:hypothetical protein KUTeg_002823 [Tegillarca granosa]|uniref:Uncharacterized protein n=1 Tax=Tegillarca granosa TaxID=220873 RepID=A0ABQ9FSA0_TEGGR|nr:hypothetical protein KUTeg_002823 [Tegillarca granosa]
MDDITSVLALSLLHGQLINHKPLAHHNPHVIETSLDSEWKITPKMLKSLFSDCDKIK